MDEGDREMGLIVMYYKGDAHGINGRVCFQATVSNEAILSLLRTG